MGEPIDRSRIARTTLYLRDPPPGIENEMKATVLSGFLGTKGTKPEGTVLGSWWGTG